MELVSDIITKERRSRPLPNAARIPSPLLSLIARDVEIHLINDPPSSPLPSIWETTFHELVSHFLKTLFLLSPCTLFLPPPPPSIFALEKNSLSFNGVVPHLFANS